MVRASPIRNTARDRVSIPKTSLNQSATRSSLVTKLPTLSSESYRKISETEFVESGHRRLSIVLRLELHGRLWSARWHNSPVAWPGVVLAPVPGRPDEDPNDRAALMALYNATNAAVVVFHAFHHTKNAVHSDRVS